MLGRFTAPGPSRERPLPAPGPRLRPVVRSGSVACKGCGRRFVLERYEGALRVCPWCGHHGQLPATARVAQLADPDSLELLDIQLADRDPLGFDDGRPYPARVAEARQKTGLSEAFLIARATVGGIPTVLACMDFGFLGGSLGSAAGELFVRGCELAVAERRALVAISSSGGARMQEGIASLAQMARCSAGVSMIGAAGLPYISVLADPCFGGVTASFAAQGDVILAEPGARIGFAGGRVIEQAAHEALPEGFQTAEFLLSHGMVDQVVDRRELRELLVRLLLALSAGSVRSAHRAGRPRRPPGGRPPTIPWVRGTPPSHPRRRGLNRARRAASPPSGRRRCRARRSPTRSPPPSGSVRPSRLSSWLATPSARAPSTCCGASSTTSPSCGGTVSSVMTGR